MKNFVLRKILLVFVSFVFLFNGVSVCALTQLELASITAGTGDIPTLKTVYSIDELSEYLSTYRVEYAKDKSFCTLEKDYPGTGEYYNKLDCIYFPSNVDLKLITRIELCSNNIYVYYKKDKNATEETELQESYAGEASSYDYYLHKLEGRDRVTDTLFSGNEKTQPNLYKKYLEYLKKGILDLIKSKVNGVTIISTAYLKSNSEKDIGAADTPEMFFEYYFNNYGHEFFTRVYAPDRESGYKYCDLVKVPITIKKDLSAGEACYEECESLN